MKIFVINLELRTDRLDHVTKELTHYQWERFNAVNGKDLTYKKIRDEGFDIFNGWIDPLLFRQLTYGEIACAMSHFKLWEKCIELDEPILILEDDIVVSSPLDFSYLNSLINVHDIVYICHKEMREHDSLKDTDLTYPCYPYLGSGYIIKPKTAKRLVQSSFKKNIIPIDEYLPIMIGNNFLDTGISKDNEILENFKYLQDIFLKDQQRLKAVGFRKNLVEQLSRNIMGSDIEQDNPLIVQTHVLTVATDTPKAGLLYSSADKHKINIVNLGERVKWLGGDMTAKGGGQKLNLVYNYLINIPDECIVMFVDGYDVIVNDNLDTIISRFKSFECDILFAAEKTCWPEPNLANQFPHSDTEYKYLNSGCYIGYAGELKKIIRRVDNRIDDQEFLQNQFLEQVNYKKEINIKLDTENYIFQCLAGAEGEVKILHRQYPRQLINTATNTCPCILHGNGNTKGLLKEAYDIIFNESLKFDWSQALTPVGPDLLVGSFLSDIDCANLIQIAENANKWESMYGDKFPGQEVRIRDISTVLFDVLSEKFMKYIVPPSERYWHPLLVHGIRDMFIIKYSPETQSSLNCHHDASLISGIVRLNGSYEGGETYFHRQDFSNKDVPIGNVLVWPGQVTHGHEGKPVTSGTKYNLVIWTSRYNGDVNF
jgi:GR25 family glycosyltransferase involved in LPS biosynthesis